MHNSKLKRRYLWTLTGSFVTSTIVFFAITAPLYISSSRFSTITNVTAGSEESLPDSAFTPRTQPLGNTLQVDDCVTDITYAPTYNVSAYHSQTLDFSLTNNQLAITNSSPDNSLIVVDRDLTPVEHLDNFNVPTQAVYFKSVVDETAMMT